MKQVQNRGAGVGASVSERKRILDFMPGGRPSSKTLRRLERQTKKNRAMRRAFKGIRGSR